jgi:hypothetical protein
MTTPQLPPRPPIPDELRKFKETYRGTGSFPADRQAQFLAMMVSHLSRQLSDKGFLTSVETRPTGWTLHVDIADHPSTAVMDDITVA